MHEGALFRLKPLQLLLERSFLCLCHIDCLGDFALRGGGWHVQPELEEISHAYIQQAMVAGAFLSNARYFFVQQASLEIVPEEVEVGVRTRLDPEANIKTRNYSGIVDAERLDSTLRIAG